MGKITYTLPDPKKFPKYYNKDYYFEDIDWKCWDSVIDGFRQRFIEWYFEFLKFGHASYVAFCSLCALVDVFTYYDGYGEWHEPKNYKEFLRKLDPVFKTKLKLPITISRFKGDKWRQSELKDYADVFYSGVRCSLHHHGDLASYAGMTRTNQIAKEIENAGKSVCGKYTYSLVVFDPGMLKKALESWFQKYCDDLKKDPSSDKAKTFRKRFEDDFGIIIKLVEEIT